MDISEIIAENERRRRRDAERDAFDPVRGLGCSGSRVPYGPEFFTEGVEMVPAEMLDDKGLRGVRTREEWARLRCRYDFEYWCAKCASVKDKESPRLVKLILNRGQRRVVAELESQRRAGLPMRVIVLKARQWGASTVIALYIAWIQLTQTRNWHSLLTAHCAKTAADIRGTLSTLLLNYPEELWDGDGKPSDLKPYQGRSDIREIPGRECHITLGTAESVNSVRGSDYAMAHLSEVGFWKDTPQASAADFIRSIYGAVNASPMTLVAMESTANGVGSFFHKEWLRSEAGKSDKAAVFVPWYEIDLYTKPVLDPATLWNSLDAYERELWHARGLTLERVNWYHCKRREYPDHFQMMAEFPTTPAEAFTNTGANVFSAEAVDRLRSHCRPPLAIGEIDSATGHITGPHSLLSLRFTPDTRGLLHLWELPSPSSLAAPSSLPPALSPQAFVLSAGSLLPGAKAAPCEGEARNPLLPSPSPSSYVVAVDVGGRSSRADWSVIAVFAVPRDPSLPPRVVAQWRGHIDHDHLTWKAARIATFYNRALLVFESNSLEAATRPDGSAHGAYILNELYDHYDNLYYRVDATGASPVPGFHTNRATKQMIINELVAAVRDTLYEERDTRACDELSTYEQLPNGAYAATSGNHDDILMTRAIGLHACRDLRPRPSLPPDPDLLTFLRPY